MVTAIKNINTKTIRETLAAGRRLDAGCVCDVAVLLLKNPRKTAQVVECLWDEDAGVANRAAMRWSGLRAGIRALRPWKEALLGRMLDAEENKLRWNLALMISRTALTRQSRNERPRSCVRGSRIRAPL